MAKRKNKTLDQYQLLVQNVQNKKYKKSYISSFQKKDKTGYILIAIPVFVFVFVLTMFMDSKADSKQEKNYNIPSSTKVIASENIQNIVEEINSEQNDNFAIVEEKEFITKEFFAPAVGTYSSNELIGQVARAQLGNKGGQPFWSYWGFKHRVAWCAIFASWCADQLGYIEKGIVPYFASVGAGTNWFIKNGLWARGNIVPSAGMYIFFDSDDPEGWGPQDGKADHVGIVEKVEDGYIYCIEGNYKDAVCATKYPLGYYQILGFGTPEY